MDNYSGITSPNVKPKWTIIQITDATQQALERKLLQGRCIVALWLSIYLSIYLLTFFNLPRPATAATAAATTTTATA